jgi:chromosome segregation ATPase
MMEKGSFHTSPNWVELQDERVKSIPLPNQLPDGINFKELPPTAIKSSTLEALIHQNEDLMARLTVTLRKNGELEDRIAEFETETKGIRARFETLKEQYLILQEKDRISASRALQMADENSASIKQIQKLEALYGELIRQAQDFQRRIVHLERYRARARKASAGIKRKARHLDSLLKELNATNSEPGGIRQALHAQQKQIINNYEAKLADVRVEIQVLREKAGDRDQIFEDRLRLQNQIVYDQRQFEMRSLEYQTELDRLQEENSRIRVELKEAVLERETLTKESSTLRHERSRLEMDKSGLTEQVESLQALWSHKQKELDQTEEKNRSLQKLNQNISLTLNQQRKEIHALQTELDKERFVADEKIKTLIAEIHMLRRQLEDEHKL